MATTRRKRIHGEESRQRILDAAAQIAGERGYDGTSIALVSKSSGLPASSIYWHFKNKDELIAAVIERSFNRWLEGMRVWVPAQKGASREERLVAAMRKTAAALLNAPDFLRLGLMLALERRPQEATARNLFLQVRDQAFEQLVATYSAYFAGELGPKDVRRVARLAMAAADGLFIAREVDPAGVDFEGSFVLLAKALLAVGADLSHRSDRSRNGERSRAR